MTLNAILNSVPDAIWSGVVASSLTSLLALGGVLLANRSSTTRLKIQLEHESKENAKQRLAELRKEVYLLAAEESVRANAYLASLPNADLSKHDAIAPLHGFFAAATKLQMVADAQTASHTSQLVSTYGRLLFKVLELVKPIQSAQFKAQLAKQQYDETQTEIKRILAAMTALNESGKPDQGQFAVLERSFEFQRNQAAKHSAEQQTALNLASSLHLSFLTQFLPATKEIGMKTLTLMVEIRSELELESDGSTMEAELRAQWQQMEESVDSLLKSLG